MQQKQEQPLESAKVWLVAAHPAESWWLRNRLDLPNPGLLSRLKEISSEQLKVELIQTGVGRQMAINCLNRLTEALQPPDLVINFGFSGILDTNEKLSSLFLITKSITPNKPEIPLLSALGTEFCQQTKHLIEKLLSVPVYLATVLTVEEPIADSRQRDFLFHKHLASLVDMELYYLADWCKKYDVDLLSLKATSDYADKNGKNSLTSQSKKLSKLLGQAVLKLLNNIFINQGKWRFQS